MQEHSDWFRFFAGFWWLIFPLGWGIAAMIGAFLRHKRAQQALEVIQTFAQQGKEIPPDVLKILQQPDKNDRLPQERARNRSRGLIFVGFIFVALALSFPVLIYGKAGGDDIYGLWFVTVLMAGFAAAFFVTAYLVAKDHKRLDPP